MNTYIEITTDGTVINHPSVWSWTLASIENPQHTFTVTNN